METVPFGKRARPVVEETAQPFTGDGLERRAFAGEDRRSKHRQRVLKRANIRFNSGYGAFSCRVRNLTEEGALVLMDELNGLPGEFDFIILGEEKGRRARVAWHGAGKIGLRFQ